MHSETQAEFPEVLSDYSSRIGGITLTPILNSLVASVPNMSSSQFRVLLESCTFGDESSHAIKLRLSGFTGLIRSEIIDGEVTRLADVMKITL